jgi:hypothetical protein
MGVLMADVVSVGEMETDGATNYVVERTGGRVRRFRWPRASRGDTEMVENGGGTPALLFDFDAFDRCILSPSPGAFANPPDIG